MQQQAANERNGRNVKALSSSVAPSVEDQGDHNATVEQESVANKNGKEARQQQHESSDDTTQPIVNVDDEIKRQNDKDEDIASTQVSNYYQQTSSKHEVKNQCKKRSGSRDEHVYVEGRGGDGRGSGRSGRGRGRGHSG